MQDLARHIPCSIHLKIHPAHISTPQILLGPQTSTSEASITVPDCRLQAHIVGGTLSTCAWRTALQRAERQGCHACGCCWRLEKLGTAAQPSKLHVHNSWSCTCPLDPVLQALLGGNYVCGSRTTPEAIHKEHSQLCHPMKHNKGMLP